jgi:hypothetical protein
VDVGFTASNVNFGKMAADFNEQREVINSLTEEVRKNRDALSDERRFRGELEKRLLDRQEDFRRMYNMLSSAIGVEKQNVAMLIKEVVSLKTRAQLSEDGTMRVMEERLQKLEDRMAEKDEEIAVLRGKVH